jgi:hypothetical protein
LTRSVQGPGAEIAIDAGAHPREGIFKRDFPEQQGWVMAEVNPRQLITTSLELVGKLNEEAKKLGVAELADDLGTLKGNLQDLREAVLELRESNDALRERVKTLEDAARVRPNLVRHKGVYWVKDDPEPWCPMCWEKDQIALHINRTDLMAGRLCACPRCGYNVNLDNTAPPKEWTE